MINTLTIDWRKKCAWLILVFTLVCLVCWAIGIHVPHIYVYDQIDGRGPMDNVKYIVYTCNAKTICGGYGDRQRGIVDAYLLANITGRRLKIEMTTPCNITRLLKPRADNWITYDGEFEAFSSERKVAIDADAYTLRKQFETEDIRTLIIKDVFYLTTNQDFIPYLNNSKLYKEPLTWLSHLEIHQVYHHVLQQLFDLQPLMRIRLESFFKSVNNKLLVCAQIRIGRNPTIPNDSPRNDIKTIGSIWRFLEKFNNSEKFKLFVTTDSEYVRNIGKTMFSGLMLDTDGPIVHIDRSRDTSDACRGFEKTVLDLEILSRCDILVISISGFGRAAAFKRGINKDLYLFDRGTVTPTELTSKRFLTTNHLYW